MRAKKLRPIYCLFVGNLGGLPTSEPPWGGICVTQVAFSTDQLGESNLQVLICLIYLVVVRASLKRKRTSWTQSSILLQVAPKSRFHKRMKGTPLIISKTQPEESGIQTPQLYFAFPIAVLLARQRQRTGAPKNRRRFGVAGAWRPSGLDLGGCFSPICFFPWKKNGKYIQWS